MEDKSELMDKEYFNKNKTHIDYRFKVVYTTAMLSVIAEHCRGKGSIELNIQGWFHYSSYHMPLFMFSAGYFFKENYVDNITEYIIKKFKKLIMPIYLYNFFYGFYILLLKNYGFSNNIRDFGFKILFIEPLGGCGFKHITPSWFSSSLFYVEVYNIVKRKLISISRIKMHEPIYFLIDTFFAYNSIILSNKGYNKFTIYMHILRFLYLNIYYEVGIIFKKHLEKYLKSLSLDVYFIIIFSVKLLFHIYYSKEPYFFYARCIYYGYSPFTVLIIPVLGIGFWVKISETIEPLLGKNYYVNIIADNTFSIMINHSLAQDIVRSIFALISKKTKYCKNFDFKRYYSMDHKYIYIPNNVLQIGIFYFLSCLIIPIIIQKIINKLVKIIKFSYNKK